MGSYRLFDLPGNGVMQISDGGPFLNDFFRVGEEVVGYRDADDLIGKIDFYLKHEEERKRIALNGYRRAMKDHRFAHRMVQLGELVSQGKKHTGGEIRSGGATLAPIQMQS